MAVTEKKQLDTLQKEMAKAIENYKKLSEKNIVKYMPDFKEDVETPLKKIKMLLKKGKTGYAKTLLDNVHQQLEKAEKIWAEKREKLSLKARYLIKSSEKLLNIFVAYESGKKKTIADLKKEFNVAKKAMEKDEWNDAEQIANGIITTILKIRQQSLAKTTKQHSIDEELVKETIQVFEDLPDNSGNCRMVQVKDVVGLFNQSDRLNTQTIRLAFVAHPENLSKLLSTAYGSSVNFNVKEPSTDKSEQTDSSPALLWRLKISKDAMAYIVGLPSDLENVAAWDELLSEIHGVLCYMNDLESVSEQESTALDNVLVHKNEKNVFVVGEALKDDQEIDKSIRLNNENHLLTGNLNVKKSVLEWFKTVLDSLLTESNN